ncbi:hypothetical protein [Nonomuraea insulae]|uniref:Uncharacterized protein n=1 Tax=Nonomuraea insulae TaxID=1616787 RepID=A0ABW1DAY1_9ACTN
MTAPPKDSAPPSEDTDAQVVEASRHHLLQRPPLAVRHAHVLLTPPGEGRAGGVA